MGDWLTKLIIVHYHIAVLVVDNVQAHWLHLYHRYLLTLYWRQPSQLNEHFLSLKHVQFV